MALAAGQHLTAAVEHVADMFLDLGHRLLVDERAGLGAFDEPVAHLQLLHGGGELFGEGVIDARLDVDPVRADAGLAVVAELRGHGALHRGVEIGIVEDDEGPETRNRG